MDVLKKRAGSARWLLGTAVAAMIAGTAIGQDASDGMIEPGLRGVDAPVVRLPKLKATLTPVDLPGANGGGGIAGGCPPALVRHTDADFTGGSYIVQAGFEQGETAACSYTVPAEDFPLRIDLMEMIFATSNAIVQTTTEWSVLVWEGTPDTGNLVASFSSDDIILPHIVLPPGTNGVNVQVSVDPGDPEQIIVTNDGSNTFSIGYRIDAHNVPGNPCLTPPPSNQNAFPTTDVSGLASPTGNWIDATDGTLCELACGVGWFSFQSFPQLCTPSGDWVMQCTYTPINCPGAEGACCFGDGTCTDGVLAPDCQTLGGTFQGDGSDCAGASCPQPEGACCFMPSGCLDLSAADCGSVGGFWQGVGSDCATSSCFATGACCLPDGSCLDDVSPDDCANQSGAYQGDDSTCAGVSCPQPEGACCFPNESCLDLTEADCNNVPGTTWLGAFTDCATENCSPLGACCFENGSCLPLTQTDCEGVPTNTWLGAGTDCLGDPCNITCPGDCADGDGMVGITDLLALLAEWGLPGPCDIDGGNVAITDLLELLATWGPCP